MASNSNCMSGGELHLLMHFGFCDYLTAVSTTSLCCVDDWCGGDVVLLRIVGTRTTGCQSEG